MNLSPLKRYDVMLFSGIRLEMCGVLFSAVVLLPIMLALARFEIRYMIEKPDKIAKISVLSKISRAVMGTLAMVALYFSL